jgi:hypothetical protein
MTASYLKRHYLNDAKLAQRALLEFHRALSSGRLIAFTGSMTTQPCGYGTWAELIDAYGRLADIALDIAEPNDIWERMLQELRGGNGTSGEAKNRTIERFRRFLANDTTRRVKIDPRVALSLFEEVLLRPDAERAEVVKQWGDWELDQIREPIDLLSIGIARYFRRPYRQRTEGSAQDVLSALIDDVGVRRIATLNYDLELEGRLMLADQVLEADEFPFDRLRRLRASGNRDLFDWDLSSGRIRRVMPNGHAVESDILNRERIDRMLEFAIGADDVDYHILHLHGRACSAESMILSYRDYDQLYRRQGLSKLPFEFAQRILMGGNPVLFVGMGMSEAEINQALQDFVSSSPYQRVAPTFLLWNAEDVDWENAHGVSGAEMRRLDWLHRLGVLTIFDTDLTREDVRSEDPVPARLARLLRELPKRAALVGGREEYTGGQAWRQMVKAQDLDGPVLVWEVADTSRDVGCCKRAVDAHVLRKLTDRIRQESAVGGFGIVARQGCGKGSLAWRLAFRSDALDIKPENVILINASFSFDTDSVLDAIARFFDARTNWRYTGRSSHSTRTSWCGCTMSVV